MRYLRKRVTSILVAIFLAAVLLTYPLPSPADPAWQLVPEAEKVPLATGVEYSAYRINAPGYTEAVKVLTINPRDRYTVMESAVSHDNLALDLERPTAMAARLAGEGKAAVAAINGDFYSTRAPYLPIGLQISNGELLISPQGYPVLGLTGNNEAIIGTPVMTAYLEVSGEIPGKGDSVTRVVYTYPIAHVNRERGANMLVLYTPAFGAGTGTNEYGMEVILGDIDLPVQAGRTYSGTVTARIDARGNTPIPADGVVLSGHGKAREFLKQLHPGDRVSFTIRFSEPRWHDVVQAVGGRDIILKDGQIVLPAGTTDSLVQSRHPRTAAGITKDGRLEIVVADGRQPGYSDGMTLYELAAFMQSRGIVAALNLDGGGSSVLAARNAGEFGLSILNRPAGGEERPVTNGLVVFSTAPRGKLSHLYLFPGAIKVYKGSKVPFVLKAQDNYYNPVPVPERVSWQVRGEVGRFVSPGLFQATKTGRGEITAGTGRVKTSAEITVVDEVYRLEINPAVTFLQPGNVQQFTVTAYDAGGNEIYVDGSLYRWTASEGLSGFDPEKGQLVLAGPVSNAWLKVGLGDHEAVAAINPALEMVIDGQPVAGQEVNLVVRQNGAAVAGAVVRQVRPEVPQGRVTARALYVRTGPGTNYKAITLVPEGYRLAVLAGPENGWLRVRLQDGREGYCYGDYVAVQEGSRTLGHTDAQGTIPFKAVVAGSYSFVATKEGFLQANLDVVFNEK
ncbi:phosphodiester glycosidase family protein [Moorella sulfitireducens]|uniref:phosphodiester glycosidase family protein n=1 Tax=Neomoorella sulfitireducens TaxID=2972948 RepID=UPI0021AD226D|nr:phosphodiester glycosidase family protein [Moorella sulfitireducens]